MGCYWRTHGRWFPLQDAEVSSTSLLPSTLNGVFWKLVAGSFDWGHATQELCSWDVQVCCWWWRDFSARKLYFHRRAFLKHFFWKPTLFHPVKKEIDTRFQLQLLRTERRFVVSLKKPKASMDLPRRPWCWPWRCKKGEEQHVHKKRRCDDVFLLSIALTLVSHIKLTKPTLPVSYPRFFSILFPMWISLPWTLFGNLGNRRCKSLEKPSCLQSYFQITCHGCRPRWPVDVTQISWESKGTPPMLPPPPQEISP